MDDGPRVETSVIVDVLLTEEEVSAVDGWRQANRIDSRRDAVRELVRLGLLSEIGRIYRSVSNKQPHN